jgi:transcriptional regulator with XRE-family HTH domain
METVMLSPMTRAVSPDDVVPAEWLAAALAVTGVSQSELARRIGAAAGTINRYKQGRLAISMRTWFALTHALGLPSEWQPPTPPVA